MKIQIKPARQGALMFHNRPKLHKIYRLLTHKKDPRVTLTIPKELLTDLTSMSEFNGRTVKIEILTRLMASLLDNDNVMARDRLNQLIWNSKLAKSFTPKLKLNIGCLKKSSQNIQNNLNKE